MDTTDQDLARDVYLDLVRAHDRLTAAFAELFADHGLTQAQFNVLRILLGGPSEGLPCQVIGARLLSRVPDVTRLVDRMEAGGLVSRRRSARDGRVVLVRASRKGRAVCERLAEPVAALHERQIEHLSPTARRALQRGLRALATPPIESTTSPEDTSR